MSMPIEQAEPPDTGAPRRYGNASGGVALCRVAVRPADVADVRHGVIDRVLRLLRSLRQGLALVLCCVVAILSGCAGSDEGELSLAERRGELPREIRECFEKDRLDGVRLDEEIGPLLPARARSTFDAQSACDSSPEGGAYVTYELNPEVPPREIVAKFSAAGWADLPKGGPGCRENCIIHIGKRIDGRRVELTVTDWDNGSRILEASFAAD